MSRDGPRTLSAALDASAEATSPLARLATRVRRLQQLEALVHEHLPSSARPHVAVAGLDGATLKLLCRSAAWASRIRYSQRAMLAALERAAPGAVRTIEIGVRPAALQRSTPDRRAAPRLSEQARDHLERAAADEGDSELGRALDRLAHRAR